MSRDAKEEQPEVFEYQPPIDKVCPGCGCKHIERGVLCLSCSSEFQPL